MNMMNRAIFLDRDGVLIKDTDLITSEDDICILPDVCNALMMFVLMQYKLIVVSNQPVVARGLLNEDGVRRLHTIITNRIEIESSIQLDDFFFCPHHPDATVERYRTKCSCRKPEPGMLLDAAKKHDIDLQNSYMIGDRITDCIAGSKAGCTTVQVCTGKHNDKPIVSTSEIDASFKPDHICDSLFEAAKWIGNR
jgi:D-glycero-D-manno-heptose 1,7-bisphosphate phosphatase